MRSVGWEAARQPIEEAATLDILCTRFETAWRNGQAVTIESVLEAAQAPMRPQLLHELIAIEAELRSVNAEAPSAKDYLDRFPECAPWIQDLLLQSLPQADRAADGSPAATDAAVRDRAPRSSGPESENPGHVVADRYELLEEIGRGGMGVVHRARERATGRIVALKLLRQELLDELGSGSDSSARERFRVELQAAARLEHEHILPVYDVGDGRQQHYYTMRYLPGRSLRQVVEAGPQSPRQVAAWLAPIARAVEHAHHNGIIHRDLKPHNILLDGAGQPFVTDFGLAKLAGGPELTRTTETLGTPAYMAPEQIQEPGRIDARADVYALGATIYHLICGRPPFSAATVAETLQHVLHSEPPPPRQLNPAVDVDLETICLKCLQKEPGWRYPSAHALADDLSRYLRDEPILAQRSGQLRRIGKWARRNRAAAALLAMISVFALIGFPGVAWLWRDALGARNRASLAQQRAELGQRAELEARGKAEQARRASELDRAKLHFNRGLQLAEQGEPEVGVFWMLRALDVAPEDATDLVRLVRMNLAAWEPTLHSLRRIIEHPAPVKSAAMSPDGSTFATTCGDGLVRVWSIETGELLWSSPPSSLGLERLIYSPDGRTLAVIQRPNDATKSKMAQLFDIATGTPYGAPLPIGRCTRLRFHPAREVIFAYGVHPLSWWESETGELLGGPLEGVEWLAGFTADGQPLVRDLRNRIHVLDMETSEMRPHPFPYSPLDEIVQITTGGQALLFNGALRKIWLADMASGRNISSLESNTLGVWSLSGDGRMLLLGQGGSDVRALDCRTGAQVGSVLRHREKPLSIDTSADGRWIVTATAGNLAYVWGSSGSAETPVVDQQPLLTENAFIRAEYSPDRSRLLLFGGQHVAQLWDLRSGASHSGGILLRHDWPRVWQAAFSPDGTVIATSNNDPFVVAGKVYLWSTEDGSQLVPPINFKEWVRIAFSPDGTRLVTADYSNVVQLWDVATGSPVGSPMPQPDIPWLVAFSPDGNTLAVGVLQERTAGPPHVQLWDLERFQPLGERIVVREWPLHLQFSPDGGKLLSLDRSGELLVLDRTTGRCISRRIVHSEPSAYKFSSDGRLVAVGQQDGRAQLWEVLDESVRLRAVLRNTQRAEVTQLDVAPDGRLLLAGYDNGTARLWDIATQKPIGPAVRRDSAIIGLSLLPDGHSFLTTTESEPATGHSIPLVDAQPLAEVRARLERRTGLSLHPSFEEVEAVSADAWARRKDEVTATP